MGVLHTYKKFWKQAVDVESPCHRLSFWIPTGFHLFLITLYAISPILLGTLEWDEWVEEWLISDPFTAPTSLFVVFIMLPTMTGMVRRLKSAHHSPGFIFIPLLGIFWEISIGLLAIIFAFPAGMFGVSVTDYMNVTTWISMIGYPWGILLLVFLLLSKSKAPIEPSEITKIA